MNKKSEEQRQIVIVIARRAWYEWLMWAIWFFLGLFFMQNALASHQELEPRAATIYWLIFAVLLLGGIIVWLVRRNRMI